MSEESREDVERATREVVTTERARQKALAWAALTVFTSAIGLGLFGGSGSIGGRLAGVTVATVLGAWIVSRRRPREAIALGPTTITASASGIALDHERGREDIPRDRIHGAFIDDQNGVVLEIAGGREVRVATSDVFESARIVEALGFAPERVRRLRLRSYSDRSHPVLRVAAAVKMASLVLIAFGAIIACADGVAHGRAGVAHIVAGTIAMLVSSVSAVLLYGFFRRPEISVGRDGVRITNVFGARFVPYDEVRDVVADEGGVRLVMRKGPSIELPLASGRARDDDGAVDVEREARRIREAIEAHGASHRTSAKLSALDRNARSAEEWKNAILSLASSNGEYRVAKPDPEEMALTAEDPAAPPDRRAAAALVLARSGSVEQKRRVRIAIGSSADEDMRVALEAAAEGELALEAIERASAKRALG